MPEKYIKYKYPLMGRDLHANQADASYIAAGVGYAYRWATDCRGFNEPRQCFQ